ncbi:MAG: TULIP family P47-like protein [Pseudomonadota bacterium]
MANDMAGFDLRKWDTVSAVKISTLNKSIHDAGTTPPGFDQHIDIRGKDAMVTANFRAWEVRPNGDGHQLKMALPLDMVMIDMGGQQKFCGDGLAEITVQLELLPTGSKPEQNAEKHVLVLAEPTKSEPISVDKIELSDGDFRDQIAVDTALTIWLNDHITKFTHVFAVVTLHEVLDLGEDFSWLKPTYSAYAFGRNATTPSESILAVLAMTQHRSPKGHVFQVDPTLVGPSDTVAYAISRPRVVHQMIAENLPLAFQGLKKDDLKVDEEHWKISLKTGKGPVLENIEHEGKTHEVKLERLVVTVKEQTIQVESETKTKMFWGVYSLCTSSAVYKIKLIISENGDQKIGFDLVSQTEPEHRTVISDKRKNVKKYLAIVGVILLAIAAIIVAVITFVTLGPAAVAILAVCGKVAAIAGIVAIAAGGLTALQEWFLGDDGPTIDYLTMNSVAAISWSSGTNFMPRAVALDGALWIAGSIAPNPDIDTVPLKAAPTIDPAGFQAEFAEFMQKRAA